jgi:hypothetical protein
MDMPILTNPKVREMLCWGILLMLIGVFTEAPLWQFLEKTAHRGGQPLPNLAWMYEVNWFSFLNLIKAAGLVMAIRAIFTGISELREEEIRRAWILLGIGINLLIILVVVANNFIRFYTGFRGLFIFFAVVGFLALIGSGIWLWWFYSHPHSEIKEHRTQID